MDFELKDNKVRCLRSVGQEKPLEVCVVDLPVSDSSDLRQLTADEQRDLRIWAAERTVRLLREELEEKARSMYRAAEIVRRLPHDLTAIYAVVMWTALHDLSRALKSAGCPQPRWRQVRRARPVADCEVVQASEADRQAAAKVVDELFNRHVQQKAKSN